MADDSMVLIVDTRHTGHGIDFRECPGVVYGGSGSQSKIRSFDHRLVDPLQQKDDGIVGRGLTLRHHWFSESQAR